MIQQRSQEKDYFNNWVSPHFIHIQTKHAKDQAKKIRNNSSKITNSTRITHTPDTIASILNWIMMIWTNLAKAVKVSWFWSNNVTWMPWRCRLIAAPSPNTPPPTTSTRIVNRGQQHPVFLNKQSLPDQSVLFAKNKEQKPAFCSHAILSITLSKF